jgi:glutamyl-tRNA synthetase
MKDRVTFPQDFWQQAKFLFVAPTSFDEGVVSKKWNEEAVKVISAFGEAIKNISGDFDAALAKSTLESVTALLNIGTGKILQALRLSVTGAGGGPDLMMIMEIIGRDEVVKRIGYATKTLKVKVA